MCWQAPVDALKPASRAQDGLIVDVELGGHRDRREQH